MPVVFLNVSDPVGGWLCGEHGARRRQSTGFLRSSTPLSGKWLELLKEVAPGITRVGDPAEPENLNRRRNFRTIEGAAKNLAVEPVATYVRDAAEIERAMMPSHVMRMAVFILLPGPFATVHRDAIIALAARHRLPAVSPYRVFATDGGLMLYGSTCSISTAFRVICRPRPAGHQAPTFRFSSRTIRTRHQPQDRESTRTRRAATVTRPRRRGDRMRTPVVGLMPGRSGE